VVDASDVSIMRAILEAILAEEERPGP